MFSRKILCFVLASIFAGGLGAEEAVKPTTISPEPEIAAVSQLNYVLQPFDLIEVVVFQEPDLERKARLSEESALTLPLIGTVNLAGKTIRQAQDIVTDLYNRKYLVNPQINITVLEFTKVTVNVLGSVNLPGPVVIPPDKPLNLLDAITQAGGFSRLADRKRVKLTRLGDDNHTITTIINADDIIQSTNTDQQILKKGDVVFVPERIL